MIRIANRFKAYLEERKWLKSKPCAACRYFYNYMGSAGICEAKEGCPSFRMRDASDSCNCGRFKKARRKH